jgi:hypothetical protein
METIDCDHDWSCFCVSHRRSDFSYLIGIAAALFASWYTYSIAGMFWLHDTYQLTGKNTWLAVVTTARQQNTTKVCGD